MMISMLENNWAEQIRENNSSSKLRSVVVILTLIHYNFLLFLIIIIYCDTGRTPIFHQFLLR